jgi:hypothetical protein
MVPRSIGVGAEDAHRGNLTKDETLPPGPEDRRRATSTLITLSRRGSQHRTDCTLLVLGIAESKFFVCSCRTVQTDLAGDQTSREKLSGGIGAAQG